MIRRLIILLLLSSAAMAAIGTPVCKDGGANGTNTVSNASTLTVATGDFVWAVSGEQTDSTGTVSFGDNLGGNTWHPSSASYSPSDGGGETQLLAWTIISSGGALTVTGTWNGTKADMTILVCNSSGIATSAEDVPASVNRSGTGFITSLTSATFSTAQASSLGINCVRMSGTVSSPTGGGSGWTLLTANAFPLSKHACEYQVFSSTQSSISIGMSWTSTARASSTVFVAKAAGAAPTGDAGGTSITKLFVPDFLDYVRLAH